MEEIIRTWKTLNDLVLELALPEDATSAEVRQFHLEALTSSEIAKYQFRLEDAKGNEVAFPLRLISNTTFPNYGQKQSSS